MAAIKPISVLQKTDRRAFEGEQELKKLISAVKKSRQNIPKGEIYSEEEFHGMMDNLLS